MKVNVMLYIDANLSKIKDLTTKSQQFYHHVKLFN